MKEIPLRKLLQLFSTLEKEQQPNLESDNGMYFVS